MSSSKLRKISKIVKEISMQSSQSTYDISGLDLSLCKFYYRTPQNLFKDLASGDYTIDTSSGQQSLVIQNDTVLQTGEAIQVCYNMDLTSSKYVVDFEIDINKLTTSYNELVEDVHTLWEYIRKTGMIADDTTIDLILPQLNNNEVWVKSEDGYRGMPLDDVEQSIKDIIDKYSQQKIEEIKREITAHTNKEIQRATNEITDVKDTSIQNIKDQEKTSTNNMISEINKHTEKKKVELNDHEQLKEQELNDLHEQLSTRLQELIDGAVMDKGVLPINSDWHLLDRGNYYVIDLFNSNYKNHPINIVNQNEGQGIVMVGIADDGKTKIIRYYSTSKRMFFQVLTQSNVWSEWAVVGGGNGTVYEIVQNNHGFNFNAVSLDGLTNRWVLADKNTGADAVAIKIDDNKFQLLLNGQGVIPTSSRDDKGNEFIYDEYYFLSNTVNGAFQKDKPTYGLFQPLFHTRMVENKLVADVQIGDIHDLTQHIVDSETIKEFGIATEKDLLNKLDKGNVSSNYDTAEKIEYQIKKLQANTIEDLIAMRFLKVGDIVEVLGYYSAGDGAGHKRIIKVEDDGSGVQLSNNLWACIIINKDYIDITWFGAKRNENINTSPITTQAFKKALSYGKNVFIPEGIFYIDEPLFIDVEKQWIRGSSSRSVIAVTNKFPTNEFILTFYSKNGDFYTRNKREQKHGMFKLHGRTNEKVWDVNGFRTSGIEGTDKEGHADCQIYENIVGEYLNIFIEYGSHVYRCTFHQVDGNIVKYFVKSSENQNNAGEVTTFINCGIWGGLIYLSHSCKFIGCTIHFGGEQIANNEKCCHYFRNGDYEFTNCHFEVILRTQEEWDYLRENIFYANSCYLSFLECDYVVTGNYMTVNNSFFLSENNNKNTSCWININGGHWEYLITRLKGNLTLTKGQVKIRNLKNKFSYDKGKIPKIYDYSKESFKWNEKYIYYRGFSRNVTTNTEKVLEDGSVKFNIVRSISDNAECGIYKMVDVSNNTSVKFVLEVELNTIGLQAQVQNTGYSIIALDENGDVLNISSNGINAEFYSALICKNSGDKFTVNLDLAIPSGTRKILYGVGFVTNLLNVEFIVKKCYVELI